MNEQKDLFSFRSAKPPACKHCGSSWIVKNGRYKRTSKQKHRYLCKRCGCGFVFNQSDLEKMRYKSKVIAFCVELYSRSGVSLRTLSNFLKTHFDIKASHETIREWVEKASQCTITPDLSNRDIREWSADETCVKINGEQHWLWIVFAPKHKLVIAWHLSKTRTEQDAITLFKKALKATKHRPQTLTTDQLPQYALALRKVLGRINVKHIVVEKLGDNNPIERFFREVKRRIKWFSTFRAKHSAKAFFRIFFYCYHYLKPHKTLNNKTPIKGPTLREALKGFSSTQS